jgi:NitT/TauT family transport system ATP-binding protein
MAGDLKEPRIRIHGISKRFAMRGGLISALEDISLEINDGEFICIVGPSGCGKTTLLNIIVGLENPDQGHIHMDGHEIKGPGPGRVIMFQESALFPWLTVVQNIEFGLKMNGVPDMERNEIALKQLGLVGLSGFKDAYVHELSGGMKQRVALARALAMDPEVLLMDEPFASLDAQTRDRLHLELQQIWMKTKKTIVFVTHNVSEAGCLGDRVVVLTYRPGRIKKQFKVDRPRPRHYRTEPELATITSKVLEELQGEVDKADKAAVEALR